MTKHESVLTREEIFAAAEPFGEFQYGDAQGDKRVEFARAIERLILAKQAAQVEPHPDDVAVDKFAQAMKDKLAKAREKGRGGWQTCAPSDLSWMLREHVEKGDPRDVANFCMFLWSLGSGITTPLPIERDAAGTPKMELTVLESVALEALNSVKAMADGDLIKLPEELRMQIDATLMMATARRKGVQ